MGATSSWRVGAGLSLGPAVALGLARFAYGLLLPGMRDDLGWSYSQAGTINTANALGYLAGALIAARVSRRIGERRAFAWSMAVTAAALLASAASGVFGVLLALRIVAGVAGAVTFIIGASLAARVGGARVLSLYVAGGGIGVAVSGAFVPALLDAGGAGAWRWGWIALGGLAALATVAALPAARRVPERDGVADQRGPSWRPRPIAAAMVAYTLFGAGYIAYVTFIVAFLRDQGAGTATISAFWVVLGLAAVASVFAWGPILGRLRGGRGLAVTTAIVAAGALLPLVSGARVSVFASAAVFGGAFLAVPTAATVFARHVHEPRHWTVAIAGLTIAFAFGQTAGPALAGVLSDGPSGIRAGLSFSVAVLAAGALTALGQPQVNNQPPTEEIGPARR